MMDIIRKNKEKVDNVLEKLNSSNYDFNKEEIFLILNEKSLQNKVFSIMMNDDNIWNYPIVYKVRNYVGNNIDFAYKYVIKDINSGVFSLINNDVDKDEWEHDKIPLLEELLIEKLRDPNYELERLEVPDLILGDILDVMLETQRYDDIKKLYLNKNTIDLEMFDKLMIPFEKGIVYKLPHFNINDLDEEEIMEKYNISVLPLEILDYFEDGYDYDFFCKKLENNPKEFYYFEDENIKLFSVLKRATVEEKRNLISLFLKNDYYEPFFMYDLNDLLSDDDIDSISKSIVRRKESISSHNFFRNKNILFKNEKIISSFIKVCDFSTAFCGVDNINDYKKVIKKYEKEIIRAVDNCDKKLDSVDVDIRDIYEFPEIIKAFIRHDPSLEILSFIFPSKLYDSNKEIRMMIDDILLNSDIDDIKYIPDNRNLIYKLLKNKKYEFFKEICIDYFRDKEFISALYDAFEDGNLYFISSILSNSMEIILNDKFLDSILYNKYFTRIIVDRIIYDGSVKYYTDEIYNFYKEDIAKEFFLEKDVMDKIKKVFGVSILQDFGSFGSYDNVSNTERLFDLDSEELDKILNLFSTEEYTIHDLEGVYDALKQYQFSKMFPEIINIYSYFISSIEDDDYARLESIINELKSVMDEKFFKQFREKYEDVYNLVKLDKNLLFSYIIYNIKNGVYDTDIIHFITNYYIASKRCEYRENSNMIEELKLPFTFRSKDVKNFFPKEALKRNLLVGDMNLRDYIITNIDMDKNIVNKCIDYYIGKSDFIDNDIKNNMPLIIKSVKSVLNKYYSYDEQVEFTKKYENNTLDKKPLVIKNNDKNYEILQDLNIPFIIHNVLNSDSYDSLVKVINKYKVNQIPECFDVMLEEGNYNFEWNNRIFSNFVSFYPKIFNNLKKNNIDSDSSIIDVFINSNMYGEVKDFYQSVLGDKSYYLIKSNPSPNSASLPFEDRINSAYEYVVNSFKRINVTVPTFNETIKSNSGKTLRVILGNFTHEDAIVYGEKDGSCFRIGGVEDSFYNFCFTNENGFTVRIENPITGEYISRISGFRNGNSVFLNQLRFSHDEEVSNQDLIDVTYTIGEKLVEYSKNDKRPIENVFISSDKVFYEKDEREFDFSINDTNIKKGYPSFITDIVERGIVLASVSKDFKDIKLDFDKEDMPRYLPARCEIQQGKYLKSEIERIHSINLIIKDCEEVEPLEFDSKIKYTICNKDWYICVDEDNRVYAEIIDIDKRAFVEFEKCYDMVLDKYNIGKDDYKKLIKM